MKKFLSCIISILLLSSCFSAMTTMNAAAAGELPANCVIGYWHNFSNGSTVTKLRDVNEGWDVINVSFMITQNDNCTAVFAPDKDVYSGSEAEKKAEFISDVKSLQSKGKKVVISVGGETGRVSIPTTAARVLLTNATQIISEYGFDGFDVDLENTSVSMDSGDKIGNLASPFQVNISYILHKMAAQFGSDFIISMAPEHVYVQGSISAFSRPWGGYMPFLDACRDILTYIHPQYYNNPIDYWLPNGDHFSGYNANSLIKLSEMLIDGWDLANNGGHFEGLRPDQVAFGVPCSSKAAGSGVMPISEYQTALKSLLEKYPTFRGAMTWSTNWDEVNGNAFVNGMRETIDNFVPPVQSLSITSVTSTVSGPISAPASITWTAKTANASGAVSYDFDVYKDGAKISDGSAQQSNTFTYNATSAGTYSVTVTAKDSANEVSKSSADIEVTAPTGVTISSVTPVKATGLFVGDTITWNVAASGGSGALTYTYNVYRDGKVVSTKTSNSSSFSYVADVAGEHKLTVSVADTSGQSANGSSPLLFVKTPDKDISLDSVTSNVNTYYVNSPAQFTINASGGDGIYKYSYYFLKDGKVINPQVRVDNNKLTFTPSEAGTYLLRAYVEDGNNKSAVSFVFTSIAK